MGPAPAACVLAGERIQYVLLPGTRLQVIALYTLRYSRLSVVGSPGSA